jgi:hypothetical protein
LITEAEFEYGVSYKWLLIMAINAFVKFAFPKPMQEQISRNEIQTHTYPSVTIFICTFL